MIYKQPVKIFADLPTENTTGDKRLVIFEKKIYQWNGSAWVMESDIKENIEEVFSIKEPEEND